VLSITGEPAAVTSYGDFSNAWRVTTKVKVQDQTVSVYEDVAALGKARIELSAIFSNTGQPLDPGLEEALLAKLAAKLDAA
jgi:hypothetical protein